MSGIYIANVDNFMSKKWCILRDDKDEEIPGTGTNNLELYEYHTDIKGLVEKLENTVGYYNSRIGIDTNRCIKYIIDFDKLDESESPLDFYLKVITNYLEDIFNIKLTMNDFAITKNDNYDKKPLSSYHVIIRKLIDTPSNQKIFFNGLLKYSDKFNKKVIDWSIYGKHWFRLPNQMKGKTKEGVSPGKHQIIEGSMIDFIPEYYDENKAIKLSFEEEKFKKLFEKKKAKKIIKPHDTNNKSDIDIRFTNDQLNELIPKMLELLDSSYYNDYKLWLDTLYIIKNELGEEGKEIGKKFSQKSSSYNERIFEEKWISLKSECTKKIGSLFYACYQNENNRQILRELKSRGEAQFSVTDNWLAKELKLMISDNFVTKKIVSKKQETIKILYFTEEYGWQYDTSTDSALSNYISNEFQDYIIRKYESNSSEWPKRWEQITKNLGSNMKKTQIIREFKNLSVNDNSNIQFDNQPYLLKFMNGVMDLLSGEFRKHKRTDYMLLNTHINWREPTEKELETMSKFFESIFKDAKMKHLLFKILASGLIGIFVEKFIVWWGDGGNGKGTINDFMGYLLGDYYGECNATYLTLERETGNDEILASFKGKRYIKASEPGKAFCASKIKSLTGETKITAMAKYESSDSTNSIFDAEYTFVCETNQSVIKFKKSNDESSNQKDIGSLKRRQISFPWLVQFTDDPDDLDNPNFTLGDPVYKTNEFKESHIFAFARIIIPYVKIFLKERFDDLPDQVREFTNEGLIENSVYYEYWISHYEKDETSKELFGLRDMWNKFIESLSCKNIAKAKRDHPELEFKKFMKMAVNANNIIIHKKIQHLSGYRQINQCTI
jgi:phage/plasmid-associated DNA primase